MNIAISPLYNQTNIVQVSGWRAASSGPRELRGGAGHGRLQQQRGVPVCKLPRSLSKQQCRNKCTHWMVISLNIIANIFTLTFDRKLLFVHL